MNIIQSYLTNNPCYKAGRKITVKGLMLHSVGCPQPKASVFVKNWNRAEYDRACVHGFIDANQAQKTGLAPGESVERRHQRIRDAALLPVNPNHGHGESCYCDKQKGNDDLAVL